MRAALVAAALWAGAGCVGAERGVRPQPDPGAGHYVRAIELTTTRGEVGKPFQATVTFDSNYVAAETAHYEVAGLPPGLSFDAASRTVQGVPERAGFFTVHVAVRKPVPAERLHRPSPDERWWPAEVEVEIYAPVGR